MTSKSDCMGQEVAIRASFINSSSKIAVCLYFLEVITNKDHAHELRNLYTNGKINFLTIIIGKKKLRNSNKEELS